MIAKALVDQFVAYLFAKKPLELPAEMWLAAEGPTGEIGARQRVSAWTWDGSSASNGDRISFAPAATRFIVRALTMYDAPTSGSVVARPRSSR